MMANYDKRYSLNEIAARNDGSGMVDHQVHAEARVTGSGDSWAVVPGRRKTVSIPATEIQAALAAGGNAAIATAYKQAIAQNIDTQPIPVTGWDSDSLETLLNNNDAAAQAASDASDYITMTLGATFPIKFTF